MPEPRRRRLWLFAAALLVSCGLLYAVNPAAGGLGNWQESTRALVSREMQRTGEFIAPTIFGEVYLNKPPLLNWIVVAIAEARDALLGGGEVRVADLRLAAALAGTLGIFATFGVAGILFRDTRRPGFGSTVAVWSAALLMTGILMVRSSRMGEIDVLLVPAVVAAVGAMLLIWRGVIDQTHPPLSPAKGWALVLLASLAAAFAALAKGPPPLAVIALGGLLAPIVVTSRRIPAGPARGTRRSACVVLGAALAIAFGAVNVDDTNAALGLLVYALLGAVLGQWVADLARPAAAAAWWPGVWKTQPWLVLGAGFGVLWLWLTMAEARVGEATVAAVVAEQAEGNLVAFSPEAAWRNLGFVTYAVGAGSLLAWLALARIARDRPRLAFNEAAVAVWVVLGFALFSMFAKGVARYMTPMWPAIAMLGASWLALVSWEARRFAKPARLAAAAAIALLFVGQLWWYAIGRDESPAASERRAVAQAIIARAETGGLDPRRVISKYDGLDSVAFYVDAPVEQWRPTDPDISWDVVAQRVRQAGPYVVVVQGARRFERETAAAQAAGLRVEIVPHESRDYLILLVKPQEIGDDGG